MGSFLQSTFPTSVDACKESNTWLRQEGSEMMGLDQEAVGLGPDPMSSDVYIGVHALTTWGHENVGASGPLPVYTAAVWPLLRAPD
jgi:hypothetical protein